MNTLSNVCWTLVVVSFIVFFFLKLDIFEFKYF